MSHSWDTFTIEASATVHGPGAVEDEEEEVSHTCDGRVATKQKTRRPSLLIRLSHLRNAHYD